MKVRAFSDGAEGWFTVHGNAGSTYAKPITGYYACLQDVDLHPTVDSGDEPLHVIKAGQAFKVHEGPLMETKEGAPRVRGRNTAGGFEGWFSVSPTTMLPWNTRYTFTNQAKGTVLYDTCDSATVMSVRNLQPGEKLTALCTPVLDKDSGALQIRVRAERDGEIGFAKIRDDHGALLLTVGES